MELAPLVLALYVAALHAGLLQFMGALFFPNYSSNNYLHSFLSQSTSLGSIMWKVITLVYV